MMGIVWEQRLDDGLRQIIGCKNGLSVAVRLHGSQTAREAKAIIDAHFRAAEAASK